MNDSSLFQRENVSLCEALDRILNKGAVIGGEVTISVANIDLIYLGLQLILTSVETAAGNVHPSSSFGYGTEKKAGKGNHER